jgi:hypothetical protein
MLMFITEDKHRERNHTRYFGRCLRTDLFWGGAGDEDCKQKWGSNVPLNGKVWSVKLEGETIVEMAEDGLSQFAAISYDNEYMVMFATPLCCIFRKIKPGTRSVNRRV